MNLSLGITHYERAPRFCRAATSVLKRNPILARMNEIEALQVILQGAKTNFVFGQGDLSRQIRSLIAEQPP